MIRPADPTCPAVVIESRCTGCGTCVAACSSNAIHLFQLENGRKVAMVDPDRCTLQRDCISACPHDAIVAG